MSEDDKMPTKCSVKQMIEKTEGCVSLEGFSDQMDDSETAKVIQSNRAGEIICLLPCH
jgi:peptide deformylase